MKNYLQPGDKITVPAPATVTSGSGTVIGGNLFGVATHDAASAATCTFLIEGVVSLPKHNGTAMAVGDSLHWDASAGEFIASGQGSGDINDAAVCIAAAASGDATVTVKLTAEKATAYPNYAQNVNTWAGILATKLNADAGVTDTNYDTNPQA